MRAEQAQQLANEIEKRLQHPASPPFRVRRPRSGFIWSQRSADMQSLGSPLVGPGAPYSMVLRSITISTGQRSPAGLDHSLPLTHRLVACNAARAAAYSAESSTAAAPARTLIIRP